MKSKLLTFDRKQWIAIVTGTIVAVFMVAGLVSAAVTISTNLQVGGGTASTPMNGDDAFITGTFEVDGVTRFDGVTTFNANLVFPAGTDLTFTGATTGDNDVVLVDALADALSITRGATDMMVFNTSTPSVTLSGALGLDANTLANNAHLTVGTSGTPLDQTAATGSNSGLQIHLTSDFAGSATAMKGADIRVTDTAGTTGHLLGIQTLVTKSGGAATTKSLWGHNIILSHTGGSVSDIYGLVGDVTVGASATVGAAVSPAVNNLVAGLFQSHVDVGATLSSVMIDSPVLVILKGGANNRAKADAGVMVMIDGGAAGTVTAESAFAVRDYGDSGSADEFDYGLNLFFDSAPFANTFAEADIRLSSGVTISTGTAVPTHSAGNGSIYIRTGTSNVDTTIYINTDGGTTWAAADL